MAEIVTALIAIHDVTNAMSAITSGPTAIAKTTTDETTIAAILFRREISPLAIPTLRHRAIVIHLAILTRHATTHLVTLTRHAIEIPTTADAMLTDREAVRLHVAALHPAPLLIHASVVRLTDLRHPDITVAIAIAVALHFLRAEDLDLHFRPLADTTTSIDVLLAITSLQQRVVQDRPSIGTAPHRVTEANSIFRVNTLSHSSF